MDQSEKITIEGLLLRDIPREMVVAVGDALQVGAQRAHKAAQGMNDGHLPSVIGQLRHFHMNETIYDALLVTGASPSPIRGNQIIKGQIGMFALGRFNVRDKSWLSGKRSETRKQMSRANAAMERLIYPDLFENSVPSSGAVFFVASCPEVLQGQPEAPITVYIAVPNQDMSGWLFREPVDVFLKRYEQPSTVVQDGLSAQMATQVDRAVPTLKKSLGGRRRKDGNSQ